MAFAFTSTVGAGTISCTNGGTTITGTSTTFTTSFTVGTSILILGIPFIISAIASATSLTLATAYTGTTGSGRAYSHTCVITQTGTDTSLSGLSGITQITSTVTGTGEYADNTYNLGGIKLTINGTLSINPYTERIIQRATGNSILITGTGTLNIDGNMTLSGFINYTQRNWYKGQTVMDFNTPYLRVNSGGRLNWLGGEMLVPGGWTIDAGGIVQVTNSTLDQQRRLSTGAGSGADLQIRASSTSLNINGLTYKRGTFTIIAIPATLLNYAPQQCDRAITFSSGTPKTIIPINGFNTDGSNVLDVGLWQGAWVHFSNAVNGTAMLVGPHLNTNEAAYGRVRVAQDFNPKITTTALAAIQNAVIYCRDTNNANRKNYNSDSYVNGDDTADKVYIASTEASGSLASPLSIFTGAVSCLKGTGTGTLPSAINTGVYSWDYRCVSGNTTDDFNIYVWHYSYLLSTYTAIMKGAATVTAGSALFPDTSVVLSSAAAAALTTISSASNFYDYAKYYKTLPVQANLETNGIGNLIVTRSGSTINAGAYNVTINPSAASVFAIVGNTITIKATTFVGDLVTTGTITLSGGATIDGSYQDVNGIRATATFTGLPTGCDVVILQAGTSTVLASVDANPATSYSWQHIGSVNVDVGFIKAGYIVRYDRNLTLPASNVSIQVTLTVDRTYA